MPADSPFPTVAAIRRFNRFYTGRIGALDEQHLQSAYSLAEIRVLYELAHRDRPTATELGRALAIDPGYLSRMLRQFRRDGLVRATPSREDRRQSHLSLTAAGRKAFDAVNARTNEEVSGMLRPLPVSGRRQVVESMERIQQLLGGEVRPERQALVTLRRHRPGDMGWVTHRHGVLYAEEYGWDERFEALVGRICADFIDRLDPARERCWIAERDGEFAGCVFLVRKTRTVAKLRLLLVEPGARGMGLGGRLVSECTSFAREAGYRKIVLWTQRNPGAARHLYAEEGYRLVAEDPHTSFGHALVAETWELTL